MSCNLTTLVSVCPNLQDSLDNHFLLCGPSNSLVEQFPLASFLRSPENMTGLAQTIYAGKGKVRKVELTYSQRILESAVTEGETDFCTATEKEGECLEYYDIDTTDNQTIKRTFDQEDYQRSCKDPETYVIDAIAKMVDVQERAIATRITNRAVALKGTWGSEVSTTNDELVVKTLKDGSVDPYPWTMEDIDEALLKSGYCDGVFIGGDSELWKYFRRMQSGCCYDGGVDLGDLFNRFGKAIAYDRRVATALGATKSFVVQRAALQVIYWVKAGWTSGMPIDVQAGADFVNTMIVSPRLGIPMDMYMKYVCPGVIHIAISAVTDVVGLPLDIFNVNDTLFRGVNYTSVIKVTNA